MLQQDLGEDDIDLCEEEINAFYNKVIPIALILQSDQVFKFHNSEIDVLCPKHCSPKFILAMLLEETTTSFTQQCKFGLIRLGKLGHELNESRCIALKILLNSRETLTIPYDQYLLSIKEVHEGKIELFFSSVIGAVEEVNSIFLLEISLNQQNIEKTQIIATDVGFGTEITKLVPSSFSIRENASVGSTIITPRFKNNNLYALYYNTTKSLFSGNANIYIFQYLMDSKFRFRQHLVKNVNVKELSGKCKPSKSVLLVKQETNELFILNIGGDKHGFYKIKIEEQANTSYNFQKLDCQNLSQYHSLSSRDIALICCSLTSTKYLALIHYGFETDLEESPTYQNVFSKDITWLLVDLERNVTKTVHPIIHDLANITKPSSHLLKGNISIEYQDGDLNGGYSDHVLIKNVRAPSLSLPAAVQLSDGNLFSFRPFPENPDIFQVHLSFTWERPDSSPNYYGHSFRFCFKFKEDAICKCSKLFSYVRNALFSDISIKQK